MMKYKKNHLRTSCAPVVGRRDLKKLKTQDGAVQPTTRNMQLRAKALHPNCL